MEIVLVEFDLVLRVRDVESGKDLRVRLSKIDKIFDTIYYTTQHNITQHNNDQERIPSGVSLTMTLFYSKSVMGEFLSFWRTAMPGLCKVRKRININININIIDTYLRCASRTQIDTFTRVLD